MDGCSHLPQATIAAKNETKMRTGLRVLPFVNTFLRSCKVGDSPFPRNNSRAGDSRSLHLRSCHNNRGGMVSHFHRSLFLHNNRGGANRFRRNHRHNSRVGGTSHPRRRNSGLLLLDTVVRMDRERKVTPDHEKIRATANVALVLWLCRQVQSGN